MTITEAAKASATQGPFYADAEAAEAFGRRLLVAHGLPEEDAATVARCLGRVGSSGAYTPGLQTLPHYLNRVRRGLINPRPISSLGLSSRLQPRLAGNLAFGFVVATKAMD